MEKKNLIISEWLRHELELRNYSPRTISTYCELLKRAEKAIGLPFDKITTERYKNYIHQRITEDGVSTSTVNQLIGVFKIVQVDLLKRDWDTIRIKRPRKNLKLPVVLSKQEMERMIQSTINLKHRAILMLTGFLPHPAPLLCYSFAGKRCKPAFNPAISRAYFPGNNFNLSASCQYRYYYCAFTIGRYECVKTSYYAKR